ncbi:MAG: hypothetical protein SFY92_06330 [Verrucomicrobiae bacterium]|nr:hypothetical protein [Verrucomicrobiae bacterium]
MKNPLQKMLTHWKIIVCFISLFLAGAVVGSVGTLAVIKRKTEKMRTGAWIPVSLSRMKSALDLSPDQMKELEPILKQAQQDLKGAREEAQRERQDIIRNAMQGIREVLDPEQQEKFRKLMEERAKRAKRFRGEDGSSERPGMPPGTGGPQGPDAMAHPPSVPRPGHGSPNPSGTQHFQMQPGQTPPGSLQGNVSNHVGPMPRRPPFQGGQRPGPQNPPESSENPPSPGKN